MEGLRNNPWIAACPIAALLWLGGPARAQQTGDAPDEIGFSAAGGFSRTGDTYVIRGPRIAGGDLTIEADEAVTASLDLNTRWELSGSVTMNAGTARLHADSAVFAFESNELVRAELAGDPATFEETAPEQAGPVRGEASRLVYDREAGTVQLQGSTRFMMGPHSASGCDFVYELDGGLRSGSNECGVPLSFTYVPENGEESPGGDEAADAEPAERSAPGDAPQAP